MVLSSHAFAPAGWSAWLRSRDARRPRLHVRPQVTRWFALPLSAGQTEEVPPAAGRMVLYCRQGEVWITHDGDPRDVVLAAGQCYAAEGRGALRVHALRPSSLELQLNAAV